MVIDNVDKPKLGKRLRDAVAFSYKLRLFIVSRCREGRRWNGRSNRPRPFRGYRELVGRMQAAAVAQDKNFLDITITKKLIVEENDHAVKTRVPGTWGEEARYLWIGKEKIMEIHSGKTLLTFLIPDKEYKLYSADNKVVVTMRGNDLYDGYYDKVETEVRKRYEQAERKTKAAQQKKATTVKESSIPKGR